MQYLKKRIEDVIKICNALVWRVHGLATNVLVGAHYISAKDVVYVHHTVFRIEATTFQ